MVQEEVYGERVKLLCQSSNESLSDESELPFRLLILADLGGARRPNLCGGKPPTPQMLTIEGIDRVLDGVSPQLDFFIPDLLADDTDTQLRIELCMHAMADFAPDGVLAQTPYLAQMVAFRRRLEAVREERITLAEFTHHECELAASLGYADLTDRDLLWVDSVSSELSRILSLQLDYIVQHPKFQRLEATWRSLHLLVEKLHEVDNARIDIVDISVQELATDFEDAPDATASLLYQLVYTNEFGQYGGIPYSAIIGDYHFGIQATDLTLLRRIAAVASMSHAPFIAAAAPSLLGVSDFSELAAQPNLLELLEQGPRHAHWRGLRESPDLRYVGLTLPHVRLRQAWDYRRDNIHSFNYRETLDEATQAALWGNSAFAFAACLLRSFSKHRWCLEIVGEESGSVRLPSHSNPTCDLFISERLEGMLAMSGFIPLVVRRDRPQAAFYSANSVYQPNADDVKSIDQQVAAQLPYLFVISRIAHYLKVIYRDSLGADTSAGEMENRLNEWLVRIVSDMDNPAPAVRGRRPLRRAHIHIGPPQQGQKAYQMNVTIIPHFRYLGAAFQLSLDGRLEPAAVEDNAISGA